SSAWLEVIGDQCIGRRYASRLADAHAHAEDEELPERDGNAAKAREDAPERHRRADDAAPAGSIRHISERDAEHRVEDGERRAAQRAELPIVEVELGDDRPGKNA